MNTLKDTKQYQTYSNKINTNQYYYNMGFINELEYKSNEAQLTAEYFKQR